jgi:Rrf2 family protein
MFTLTKKADYGLSMLSVLALRGRKGRINLKELAEMGMPRAFMSKIAASLVEAGILNSREGKGGGYGLNYEPKEIQVREALEAIEGEVEPVTCAGCPMKRGCGQIDFMDRLTEDVNEILEKYTLADLAK